VARLFISHSSNDDAIVRALQQALRDLGEDVWTDSRQPQGGELLWPDIRRAIERADAYAIVVSPSSLQSNWVGKELRHALEVQKLRRDAYPIVPLSLDGTTLGVLKVIFDKEPVYIPISSTAAGLEVALNALLVALGKREPADVAPMPRRLALSIHDTKAEETGEQGDVPLDIPRAPATTHVSNVAGRDVDQKLIGAFPESKHIFTRFGGRVLVGGDSTGTPLSSQVTHTSSDVERELPDEKRANPDTARIERADQENRNIARELAAFKRELAAFEHGRPKADAQELAEMQKLIDRTQASYEAAHRRPRIRSLLHSIIYGFAALLTVVVTVALVIVSAEIRESMIGNFDLEKVLAKIGSFNRLIAVLVAPVLVLIFFEITHRIRSARESRLTRPEVKEILRRASRSIRSLRHQNEPTSVTTREGA
jgi:hypothetical protein